MITNVYVRIVRAHPNGGTKWDVGRVVRVPVKLAAQLIEEGHAILFRPSKREQAVIAKYETAVI